MIVSSFLIITSFCTASDDDTLMISTEQTSEAEPEPLKEMAETSFIQNQEIVSTPTASNASSEVCALNEVDLKDLLEEAVSYKLPKDREGKSQLFRDLLQEAESVVEPNSETNQKICSSTATSAVRPIPKKRLSKKGLSGDTGGTSAPVPVLWDGCHNSGSNSTSIAERQTRGGSLQNIVHACSSETISFKPTTTTIIKSNSMTSEHQTTLSSQQISTSNKCDIQNGVEMLLLAPLNNNNISSTNHNNNNNNNGSNIKHRTTSIATTNVTEASKTVTVTTLCTNKMPYPTNSVSEELQKSDSSNKSIVTQNSARRHENISAVVNGLENVAFPLNSAYNCVRSLGVSSSFSHTSTHTAALSALTEKINSNKCSSVFDQMAAISQSKEPASTLVTASLATPVTSSAAAVASISEAISHQPQSSPNSVTTSKQGGFSILSNNWLSDGQRYQMSNTLDSKNKMDENISISSSSGSKHKFRRNKVNNPQNVIMSQNIAGYRGDTEDLEDLLQFIESSSTTIGSTNSGNNVSSNNQTSTSVNASITHNQHTSNDGHKVLPTNHSSKRETKHNNKTKNHSSTTSSRRQSESNLKKSTSMEEIHSKTKFEDLTNQSSTTTTHTTPTQNSASINEKTSNSGGQISRRKKDNARADRRSWGNEETHTNQEVGLSLNNNNTSNKSSNPSLISIINEPQFSSTSWADMEIIVGVEASSPLLLSPHNLTTGSCSSGSIGGQPSPDFHVVKKKNRKSKSNNTSNNSSNSYIQQNINFPSGSRRSRSGENRNQSNNNNHHYQSGQNSSNSYYNKENPYRGKSSFSGINQEETINTNSSQNRNNSRPFYTKYQSIQVTVADCRSKTYSVPPSDKSDSSDVDSVHSLPVSSTTVRPTIEKTSTSNGSTPQASYADIARTTSQMPSSCQPTTPPLTPSNNNFPDSSFGSSSTPQTLSTSPPTTTNELSFNLATAGQWPCVCSASTMKQGPVTTSPTSEQPPIIKTSPQGQQTKKDAGTNTNTDEIVFSNHEQAQHLSQILQINQGPNHSSNGVENYGLCPPSRHKSNHGFTDIARPPVIILNHSNSSSNDNLDQLSFGFEINQALLNEDNNLEDESQETQETLSTTLRNSSPTPCLEIISPAITHHRDLVNYITDSWNEILRSVENKNSIYYSSELS